MLYDVTHSKNADLNFTICANNDSELINALAEAIDAYYEDAYSGITLDDYNGSIWQVRELSEPFNIELSVSHKISGKRL